MPADRRLVDKDQLPVLRPRGQPGGRLGLQLHLFLNPSLQMVVAQQAQAKSQPMQHLPNPLAAVLEAQARIDEVPDQCGRPH
jgi:hypothetical protein